MFALRAALAAGRQVTRVAHRGFAADARQGMAFTFASPSEMFYHNADVRQVDVPSYSGDFGILPQHVASLAALKPGVITVYQNDGELQRYFVSSGTVTINEDSTVQVLAEQAIPVDRLDKSLVQDGLTKAQQKLTAASTEEARAEAQILVEVHEAMQKAVA